MSALLLLLLLLQPLCSAANLNKLTQLRRSNLISPSTNSTSPPTLYFEVTKPIPHPKTKPCSILTLQHSFAYTYGLPPVLANYTPPSSPTCPHQSFSKIILQWRATSKGRQFDRIFGVWLSGVELLRTCTAEPRSNGIVWNVEKDVTRYHSLLLENKNQSLAVYLGNVVDSTYTGVYHVNVTFHFYPDETILDGVDHENVGDLAKGYHSWADLIVPILRNLPVMNHLV